MIPEPLPDLYKGPDGKSRPIRCSTDLAMALGWDSWIATGTGVNKYTGDTWRDLGRNAEFEAGFDSQYASIDFHRCSVLGRGVRITSIPVNWCPFPE